MIWRTRLIKLWILGIGISGWPFSPPSAQMHASEVRALRLELTAVQSDAQSFPSKFVIRVVNMSGHPIVGGNLRLAFTIGSDHPTQLYGRDSVFAWGEFRLRPKETVTRILRTHRMVLSTSHDETADVASFIQLLGESCWSVFAYAADETDLPIEVGSEEIHFDVSFQRAAGLQDD